MALIIMLFANMDLQSFEFVEWHIADLPTLIQTQKSMVVCGATKNPYSNKFSEREGCKNITLPPF